MTAVVRGAHRPVIDGDAVLLTASTKRLGSKLFGVVEMKTGHQALHRPVCLNPAHGKPTGLVEHGVRYAEGNARCRRRLERQIETCYASRANVDRESEPRALNRLT